MNNGVLWYLYCSYFMANINPYKTILEQNMWLDKTGIIRHKEIVDFYRALFKCLVK